MFFEHHIIEMLKIVLIGHIYNVVDTYKSGVSKRVPFKVSVDKIT